MDIGRVVAFDVNDLGIYAVGGEGELWWFNNERVPLRRERVQVSG
jgi:hypothetical protein